MANDNRLSYHSGMGHDPFDLSIPGSFPQRSALPRTRSSMISPCAPPAAYGAPSAPTLPSTFTPQPMWPFPQAAPTAPPPDSLPLPPVSLPAMPQPRRALPRAPELAHRPTVPGAPAAPPLPPRPAHGYNGYLQALVSAGPESMSERAPNAASSSPSRVEAQAQEHSGLRRAPPPIPPNRPRNVRWSAPLQASAQDEEEEHQAQRRSRSPEPLTSPTAPDAKSETDHFSELLKELDEMGGPRSTSPPPIAFNWHDFDNSHANKGERASLEGGRQSGAHSIDQFDDETMFCSTHRYGEFSVVDRSHSLRGRTVIGTFHYSGWVGFASVLLRTYAPDHKVALIFARSLQLPWMVAVDFCDPSDEDWTHVRFKFLCEMTMLDPCRDLLVVPSLAGETSLLDPQEYDESRIRLIHWHSRGLRVLVNRLSSSAISARQSRPLPESELADRRAAIESLLELIEEYETHLISLERFYMIPLANGDAPSLPSSCIDLMAHNVYGVRQTTSSLLGKLLARLQAQSTSEPVIGDVLLEGVGNISIHYTNYADNLAEVHATILNTAKYSRPFQSWLAKIPTTLTTTGAFVDDLLTLLQKPMTHLQEYTSALERILQSTPERCADFYLLAEAVSAMRAVILAMRSTTRKSGTVAPVISAEGSTNERQQPLQVQSSSLAAPERATALTMLQRCFQELIDNEQTYVKDLEALEEHFIKPLKSDWQRIMGPQAAGTNFIRDAFGNHRVLRAIHQSLLSDLLKRQSEKNPMGQIADVLLHSLPEWENAYMTYICRYPLAEATIKAQQTENPRFAKFLAKCQDKSRLGLSHYVFRPIQRLVRYSLPLEQVLKQRMKIGPADHPDIAAIPKLLATIRTLALAAEAGMEDTKAWQEMTALEQSLDEGGFGRRVVDTLELLRPGRKLIRQDRVFRMAKDNQLEKLHLFLFDNYFVLTQKVVGPKKQGSKVRYVLVQRPTHLYLLRSGGKSVVSERASTANEHVVGRGHGENSRNPDVNIWFQYKIVGKGHGLHRLVMGSLELRDACRHAIGAAQEPHEQHYADRKVFKWDNICRNTFYELYEPLNDQSTDNTLSGAVVCTAPFGEEYGGMLVVGCGDGLWGRSPAGQPEIGRITTMMSRVTKVAAVSHRIVIVLSSGCVFAIRLGLGDDRRGRYKPQLLCTGAATFTVGDYKGRTLLVCATAKDNEYAVRVFQLIWSEDKNNEHIPRSGAPMEMFFGHMDRFLLPEPISNIQFLQDQLALVGSRSFFVAEVGSSTMRQMPDFADRSASEVHERCRAGTPKAIYRSTDRQYLLCYDTFGVYVNGNGELDVVHELVQWAGPAETITFHPPYLILISPDLIEIRHINTGLLHQTMLTDGKYRCTWDGAGSKAQPLAYPLGHAGWGATVVSREPLVHVSRAVKKTVNGRKLVAHQIAQLKPL